MSKKSVKNKPVVGMIGMGWVGDSLARAIMDKGLVVKPYAIDPPYNTDAHKASVEKSDIVFVAVPTPTTAERGLDDSKVRGAVRLVGRGKIAIIKSTVGPLATDSIQKDNPHIFVYHIPEFLTEANARFDAKYPSRNIIGIPDSAINGHHERLSIIVQVLPGSKNTINIKCSAKEASLIKILSNFFLTNQVVLGNVAFDLAEEIGADVRTLLQGITADPRISKSHLNPVRDGGRGAGGDCFIKDLGALRILTGKLLGINSRIHRLLLAIEEYNISLLRDSGKDHEKLVEVYGPLALDSRAL